MRVTLTVVLGYLFAIPLPRLLGIEQRWGVAGLTASAGIAGWVEFYLLRRTLNQRIGRTGLPLPFVAKLWASAGIAAGVGWAFKFIVGVRHPIMTATVVLGSYGLSYFALAFLFRLPEAGTIIGRFTRLMRR